MMMRRLYTILERKTPPKLKNLIPQSWRIKLGYQIKVAWRFPTIKMDFLSYPLVLPAGETEKSILDYLSVFYFEEEGSEEFRMYLKVAFKRFLYTLQIIPPEEGRLLEIGASPYFASMLLRRFTPFHLTYVNYFGPSFPAQAEQVLVTNQGERIPFPFYNTNVETEPLPFANEAFDVVLLCEVLEHLTNDPLYALLNIKRVLKPGGHLILTTPNVARLENVARITIGKNIYDPYSGYGPYGRHNREYTLHELTQLLTHAGFTIEQQFTSDVHANSSHLYLDPKKLMNLVLPRKNELGQYIFVRAKNDGEAVSKKPDWLYRSYPSDELAANTDLKGRQ